MGRSARRRLLAVGQSLGLRDAVRVTELDQGVEGFNHFLNGGVWETLLGYWFFYMSFPPDPMYIFLDGITLGIKSIFIIKNLSIFPYLTMEYNTIKDSLFFPSIHTIF